MAKTPRMRCIEFDRGKSLETIIREGVEAGWTWDEIARDLGVTRLTLRDWMTDLGAEVTSSKTVRFVPQEASR